MEDRDCSSTPCSPHQSKSRDWVSQRVGKIQNYLHRRRIERYHESASEKASRNTARATWVIALWTFATVCIGIFQYVVFNHQLAVMQRQLNQMQLAQRAWVTATFRVASLVKNDYGVDLGTYIDLKNVGRAPAEHVFVSARLIPDDFESALIVQREVCSQTNSLKLINESPSNTIFPEDSEETNAVSISTVKEIREYQRSVVAQRLKGNPRPSEKDINAYRETAVFSVVGCVSYMFEGSQKVHQTGFVLGLSLGEAEGGTAIPALVNTTRNGTLPDAEIRKLRLSQRLYGAFAN